MNKFPRKSGTIATFFLFRSGKAAEIPLMNFQTNSSEIKQPERPKLATSWAPA